MINPEYLHPVYIISGIFFSLLGIFVLFIWLALFITDDYRKNNTMQWIGIAVILAMPAIFAPFLDSNYIADNIVFALGMEAIGGSLPCGFIAMTMEK